MPFPLYHVFGFFAEEHLYSFHFFICNLHMALRQNAKALLREQLFPLNILHKTENDSKVYYVEVRLSSLIK